MKSVHSCREETLWQTFCPTSRSRCIFKNSDSCRHMVCDFMRLHAIACDRMRSHGIASDRKRSHAIASDCMRSQGGSQESSHVQQGGLNSTCFHFHHRQKLHLVRRPHAIACDRMRSLRHRSQKIEFDQKLDPASH